MWREVSRPKLLRPPLFFFGSSRDSALHYSDTPSLQFASSYQIDLLALPQSNDRFLPARFTTVGTTYARPFPLVVAGVHIDNFLLKDAFDRLFDLGLVRARMDAED